MVAAHKSPRLMRVLRILMALTILFAILMAILIINLQPTALNLAEAKARALATDALNDAIASVMDQNIDYGDLMQITYDSTGKVSMLCANTMRMNELGSRIVLKAQSNLNAASAQVIRIPLGAASGMAIFEGTGPNISIKMLPVGSVNTEFKTEFQSAGINQTRHKIYLEATARVDFGSPQQRRIHSHPHAGPGSRIHNHRRRPRLLRRRSRQRRHAKHDPRLTNNLI